MQRNKSGSALVIGGSMAGLLAARVLSDHYESVTIIERDPRAQQPEFRRGVPQGRHAHALLLRGQQTIFRLFPAVRQALLDAGAVILNMGRDMRWFHFGVWKCRYESALEGLSASRPLIEWTIAEHLRRIGTVHWLEGFSVEDLITDGERVTGVRISPRGHAASERLLHADLVVDASGRGSQTPRHLRTLGFPAPDETSVKIDVGYATRIYHAPAGARDWKVLYVVSQPPSKRGGLILPLEGNRWIVTLVGMHGDHPPTDERGFLEFARTLPVPDLHEAIRDAEPVTQITRYGFPAGLRRHYEKLRHFPSGLLVLGDALCSFNPVYGQGMSAASMYADALAETLEACDARGGNRAELWRSFFPRAAKVADMPWQLATGEDFRFAETVGQRSVALRFLHWYTSKVQVASGHVPHVAERIYEVMHLLKAPAALFSPDIVRALVAPHSSARSAVGPGATYLRTAPASRSRASGA